MAQPYVKSLLGSTEIVLIETRQHWMAAIRFALRPIVIGLIGLGLLALNNIFDFGDGALGIINDIIRWAVVILFLITIVWLPVDLIRWDSRRYVLTNRRVMRVEGVLQKKSVDSSLEQITDIGLVDPTLGRILGYANLTIYTASDNANEQYDQLLDGLQFKKAVLDAKEAIRSGDPMTELAPDFIVKGGTNEASMRADGKIVDAMATDDVATTGSPAAPVAGPAGVTVAATAAATTSDEPSAEAVQPYLDAAAPLTSAEAATDEEPVPMALSEPIAEPAFVVEPEPEPAAVELEPEPIVEPEPEVEAIEPEPEAVEPEPVEPEAEPEVVGPEPEPEAVEPEPVEPEPEPEVVGPEPEPEAVEPVVDDPWPAADRADSAGDVADADEETDADEPSWRKDGPTTV